jgi:hypothetical protein
MSHSVKVRTIRPHDTTDGLRAPRDRYERTAADAKQLADAGVVEIVAERPAPKRTTKRK